MATPYMQTLATTLSWFTSGPGLVKIGPVLGSSGTPIDFTVGTWSWVWSAVSPQSERRNSPALRPDTAYSASISGDASGNISITWPDGVGDNFATGPFIGGLLASNDGGASYALPWRGTIVPVPMLP